MVNKLPKSGSYVVNFKICILNIHILPIHVKTHNTVYGFHELFLNSLKQHEHGTDSFGGAYPPLPFKKNKPENIRYKNYSTQTDKLLVNQLLGYVQMMNMQYFAQFTPRV